MNAIFRQGPTKCQRRSLLTLNISLLQQMLFYGHTHTTAYGPNSTTSICCGFVRQQVVQQAVQHLDMLGCCEFVVGLGFAEDLCCKLVDLLSTFGLSMAGKRARNSTGAFSARIVQKKS